MKKLVPLALAAFLAAPMTAAFADGPSKKTQIAPAPTPAPQQTTRLGAPLKGVRMGRVFKKPAGEFY